MEISVPVRLRPLVRKQALAAMAREFAWAMGVTSESTLKVIADGISGELLRSVEILLYDAGGNDQGYVFFEIDWELHRVVTNADGKEEVIQVDVTKNIAEQISPVTDFVTSYLQAEAKARSVTRLETIYRWVPMPDTERLGSLRATHKLTSVDEREQKLLREYRASARRYGDNRFGELSLGGAFKPIIN